jgi:arginine decarboxylase
MSLLTSKIDEYINNNYSRFHSPAHCGYLGLRDLSEVEGLDDLQNPQGVLKETQEYIAQLFNSAQSFMLVNGASIGMQASCIALKIFLNCQKNTKPVLVARNIHKSTIAGIILAGLDIEWIEPFWDEDLGLFTRIDFREVNWDKYSALIITNPTYEGFYSNIPNLDLPIIVDEAHGAHYHFHPKLPKTALESGADIAVQSWHKTLGSLTQTGVLHVSKKSRLNPDLIKQCIITLQTTSPSYILLESIAKTAEKFHQEGNTIIEKCLGFAEQIKNYKTLNDDPTRLILQVPFLSGYQLDEILSQAKIGLEEVQQNFVLANINPGISAGDIARLKSALDELRHEPFNTHQKISKPKSFVNNTNIREAFFSNPLSKIVAPCPPGIALEIPGQS